MRVWEDEPIILNRKKKFGSRGMKDFNAGFEFAERDYLMDETWVMSDVMSQLKKKVPPAAEPRGILMKNKSEHFNVRTLVSKNGGIV